MPDSRSLIGQTIAGRYQITDLLGQGGMSAVFKAFDPNLQRVVAVKIIHPHLASDPKFVTRFQDEAAAVAQLRHPNIVQVHDFNNDGDLYFMVQEFVPGETLQERLRRLNQAERRMPIKDALHFAIQICRAAEYAHQRSMIHRDIKPANIMLDVYGDAILMDFGIVKILGGQNHTATGAVVGTALYLPPEMIRGGAPSPQTDIYSLGVTLFEMVNGRPPFEADSAMALMMMHINDPVPDLRSLRPEIPDGLVRLIEKALAKEPADRFQSMAEMAASLHQYLNEFTGARSGISAGTTGDRSDPVAPAPRAPSVTQPDGQAVQSAAASPLSAPPAYTPQAAEPTMRASNPAANTDRSPAGIPPKSGFPAAPAGTRSGRSVPLLVFLALGGLAFLALVITAVFLFIPDSTAGADTTPQAALISQPESSSTPTAAAPTPTIAPSATATPEPTSTPSPPPTNTPFPSLTPTPTIAPGEPFARVSSISIDDQGSYIVEYETVDFTERLDGTHLVFYFNTQSTDLGYMYGGPRPFNKFVTKLRPAEAMQICIHVSNADHSIRPHSGTCYPLPDVVVANVTADAVCHQAPEESSQPVALLPVGDQTLVRGISSDEQWWNVVNPRDISQSCWLPVRSTSTVGDIGSLPLVEAPLLNPGEFAEDQLQVVINAITLDDLGRFVIDYSTVGFHEQLPGTHLHFFYDTVPPDQVGISGEGSRLMYGGPSPFTGFLAADHPDDAKQICALVANPDHSVIPQSGNCVNLPEHHSHGGAPTPSGGDNSGREPVY